MGHSGTRWHPWRHARDRYPHIPVTCLHKLPGRRASWTTDGIYIDRALGQAARRCALTHELIHLERGPLPAEPRLAAIEERTVSALAARRLITLRDLANALSWSDPRNLAEIAEELWVDLPTLRIRLTNLTAAEVRRVGVEVGHRWPWHCDA